MEVIELRLDQIKPYEKNPRKNDEAVEYVANSIKEFGFKVPLVIDKNYEIVTGHTRYKASKLLGLETVPCVMADDLDYEQIKAFRLADNKVAEIAEWDYTLLDDEIADIIDIDLEQFGFEFNVDFNDYKETTQDRVENILNLAKGNYQGAGKYDIPILSPVYEIPEVTEWIGFNYVLSDENPAGKGVHFFIDDYQFERVWNNPEKYVDKLKEYAVVATPDFSPYGDMPLATQIYNHYRKHWVGAYWQENGITVIPTVRASTDPRSLEFYLEGEPYGGIVMISSMWATKSKEMMASFLNEYNTMYDTLNPCGVYLYGKSIDGLRGNVTQIDTYTTQRWDNAETK